MEINVSVSYHFTPSCSDCDYCIKHSERLEHFGTPCDRVDYECIYEGEYDCVKATDAVENFLEGLPDDWYSAE